MLVCGFSFVRNGVKLDYPFVESIRSALPLCDAFVVAVGKSEDDTLTIIQNIGDPKIKIIETEWAELPEEKFRVLAMETDKAFQAIDPKFDWAFYLQADELLHEDDIAKVRENMQRYKDNSRVDGLLFKYRHFIASYDYVGRSSTWYKYEIRAVKNRKSIYSYHDAQGFRKEQNQKLNVVPIEAYIYHYGWVRHPKAMRQKLNAFAHYYRNEEVFSQEDFDYTQALTELKRFEGTHPKTILNRIAEKNWKFETDLSINRTTWKDRIKRFFSTFGVHLYYKNYKLIKGIRTTEAKYKWPT